MWNELLRRKRLSTPIYVYSPERMVENYHELERYFHPDVRIFVSLKANPHPLLAKELGRVGASFDISSALEARIARAAISTDSASTTSLVGPGKSARLLRICARYGIDQLVFESAAELKQYASARTAFRNSPVLLARINPRTSSFSANEIMGGEPRQFGMDEEFFEDFIKMASNYGIQIEGLHFFLGSQIHNSDELCANFEAASESARKLAHTIKISRISLGGGFGIPQFIGDPAVDLEKVAAFARQEISRIAETANQAVAGQIESGRYIFGDAGVYLCTVLEVKRSRGRTFVIVDCGVTGFSRPVVKWGEAHQIWKLGNDYLPDLGTECTVVGPTCLPGDVLGDNVHLDSPKEGDVLAVGNAGAYGYTMSLLKWGSLPIIREVLL